MNADYLANAAIALRELRASSPIPSVLLPGAIDDADADALRTRLAAAGTTPFAIADRGRYAVNTTLRDDALWAALVGFAANVVDAPVHVVGARWLRFGRGDYALVKDDARTRPPLPHLELGLDFSTRASAVAEIVYTDGEATLTIPQVPGLLTLVDRGPSVYRHERPLTVLGTVLGGGGEIFRLRMWLAPG